MPFCGQKESMQRVFINKYFLFTVGSVCRVKRFIYVWQRFRWRRCCNGGAEVVETTVKRLLCCGFRHTGKAMGQVYYCWWSICREINIFPSSDIICFTFYIHLWPVHWLSLVHKGNESRLIICASYSCEVALKPASTHHWKQVWKREWKDNSMRTLRFPFDSSEDAAVG
jgi:hypothetical protein